MFGTDGRPEQPFRLSALIIPCKRIEICWLSRPLHQAGGNPHQSLIQDVLVAVELRPQALEGLLPHALGPVEAAGLGQ